MKPTSHDILLPAGAFSLEAVKRAAYVFMGQADVSFEQSEAGIRCTLRTATANEDQGTLERAFRREVLDQDLRISTEAQTEQIRNTILGLTFSRTGLQE